jgi:hypothetical protein
LLHRPAHLERVTSQKENKTMSKPSHIAFATREYTDAKGEKKTRWLEIGSAWPIESGKGFTIKLDAVPVDGKLSLFVNEPKVTPAASDA